MKRSGLQNNADTRQPCQPSLIIYLTASTHQYDAHFRHFRILSFSKCVAGECNHKAGRDCLRIRNLSNLFNARCDEERRVSAEHADISEWTGNSVHIAPLCADARAMT